MKKVFLMLAAVIGISVVTNAQGVLTNAYQKEAKQKKAQEDKQNNTCYKNGEEGRFRPTSRTTTTKTEESKSNAVGAKAEVGKSFGVGGSYNQTKGSGTSKETTVKEECVPLRKLKE